jgi:hypothetical protein
MRFSARMCRVRTTGADVELVERIATTTGLSHPEARRVIDDVLSWYAQPVEVVVRRRHVELQKHGVRNLQAFPQIAAELSDRLVAPPPLSLRQLRRIVYG